ncbi:MAG: arsenate reductase ArsC [Chlorobaculum sp.]
MEKKENVLFLCTGNTARSQMAEGLLRSMAGDRFEVMSAGLEPKEQIEPLAVEAMQEIGIDISSQKTKSLDLYLGKVFIHHLIVVCSKAEAHCPVIWPSLLDGRRYYWPLDELSAEAETREQRLAHFRKVRDELREKLQEWVKSID